MTTYVQDPTTPSGWRYQYEKPNDQFIAVTDDEGNPTGALVPSVPRLPDGRPVATTPEQVAALMELEDAEPKTMADRIHEFQVNAALKSAEAPAEDDELRKGYELTSRMAEEIMTPRPAPATRIEQVDRIHAARRLAADLGYGLRADIERQSIADQSGISTIREILVIYLLNANGSVSYGPCSLMDAEVRLATEAKQREAVKRREVLAREFAERKRTEAMRRMANSPEGRIAALERKLAEATGEPLPEPSKAKYLMPGVVIRAEINDVPVEVPL